MSLVLQCSVYSGFGHGTQHTVLRTLYTVQALPQFFTWSPLQQNYMVKSFYRTLCYYYCSSSYCCCYYYYYLFCHSLCWCSFCASAGHKPCTWSISHSSQSFCSYTKRPPEDSCRTQHTDLLGLCHSSFL